MKTKRTRTSRSFAWSFLQQGGAKVVKLIVQIVLARILAPESFGVLAIFLVVTQVADAIAQSGLGSALIQKTNSSNVSWSTAWWLSFFLSAIAYALIFVFAPVLAAFYDNNSFTGLLRVIGLVVFFDAASTIQRSFLQRSLDFKSIFLATVISTLGSGLVSIALAYAGLGIWALVAQTLILGVLDCTIMWLRMSWKPHLVFNFDEAKELFSYGWKICVTGILNVFYSGISELIIGRACSAHELGLYSYGKKYSTAAIGLMSDSITNVLFPVFSLAKQDKETLQGSIKQGIKLGTFIVAPLSLLAAVVAEPLICILLTDKWLDCVPIFQLTCIASSVLMFQLVNLRAYMALGDSALYMRIQIIKTLVGGAIVWSTATITKDIYATAVASFVVELSLIFLVDMPPAGRLHGYSAFNQIKDVAPILAVCFVSSGVALSVQLLHLNYVLWLLIQCMVFVLVYLLASKLLGFQELKESKELVLSLLRAEQRM